MSFFTPENWAKKGLFGPAAKIPLSAKPRNFNGGENTKIIIFTCFFYRLLLE